MFVRRCRRCGLRKPLDEYHRWGDGHQTWCKLCKSKYAAAHYQANRERRYAHNRRNQAEFMAWYVSLKAGRPCADCGGQFHPVAMQWDHLPGSEKTACLGDLAKRGNRRLVLEEIAKCELVCANCHAVRSYRRKAEFPVAFGTD